MKKRNLVITSIIVSILFLFSLVWADSNGVWHLAKDIRGGTFGSDEQDVTSGIGFAFANHVTFNDFVLIQNDLNVTGDIYQNNHKVSTLDALGKVPLEQLPFHKGDLLTPTNRPLVSGLGVYDSHYFDITDLGISGSVANYVIEGVSFGPNKQITGGFSLDNICSAAGGNAQCGVTQAITPGDFYSQIGLNSPTSFSYCTKISVGVDGVVTSTNIQTAGVCKYISACDSTSQNSANYVDGTSCGAGYICNSGSCIINSRPLKSLVTYPNVYAAFGCAGAGWKNLRVVTTGTQMTISTTSMRADYHWDNTYRTNTVNLPVNSGNYPYISYAYGRDNTQLMVSAYGDLLGRCKNYRGWTTLKSNAFCDSGFRFAGDKCLPN